MIPVPAVLFQALIIVAILVFIVVSIILVAGLAKTRREVDTLARQKQQPAGDELGKVRENIEQLLDVLEERSVTADRKLRQLLDEAKEAAKHIEDATAAAAKLLDRAEPKTGEASLEAVAAQEPPAQEVSPDAEQSAVAIQPSPAESAQSVPQVAIESSVDDIRLEPIATEGPPNGAVSENVSEPATLPLSPMNGNNEDPLSAWAPYRPETRAKKSQPAPRPAPEAQGDPEPVAQIEPQGDPEPVVQSEPLIEPEPALNPVAEEDLALEPVAEEEPILHSLAKEEPAVELVTSAAQWDQAPEEEQGLEFQPFAIKPSPEPPTKKADTDEEGSEPQPDSFVSEEFHFDGKLAADDNGASDYHGDMPEINAEPVEGAQTRADAPTESADPYSAVYTLTELGVTDVSEIARRTGLGQTEVEMVLNLWRRQ